MAGRKENLKALFSNTRSRVVIVFTLILVVLTIVIGYIKLRNINAGPEAVANLSSAPGAIQSIPGVLDPTAQYAKLQEEQNITQAAQAAKTGGSSIPTIIRTQALGEGVGVIGSQNGQSGVGFATLARSNDEGNQRSLWIQALQNGSCSKSVIAKVISQGAKLSDLKSACSCVQLKDSGYALQELNEVCACKELKAAGYNARQLKDAGYNASRLRDCGFNACELRAAGFSAQEMKDAGFSDGELKGAGFTDDEINRASGLPDGITTADVLKAGCSPEALSKLRNSGVSASVIRRTSGCSAAQLKAAGFSAKDLKDAGFSAADLLKAGFTAEQLKAGAYSARDLLNAGVTPAELAKLGYTGAQIKEAETEFPPGITAADLKQTGCDVDALKRARVAGVSATVIKRNVGCTEDVLKAAGFSDADLENAGATEAEIRAITPLTDADVKAAGCDLEKMRKLFLAGASAKRIKDLNGCSAEALRKVGFDPKSMLDSGYTPAQLLAGGFTANTVETAGASPTDIIAQGRTADCSVESLRKARAAGVSAATIKKTLGCSAKALKDAGYTAKELKDAGFTAAELKNAGFSAKDLKAAGFSAKELKDAGFNAKDLKDAGFSATDLKGAGFNAKDLKDAGFSAADLKTAGFSAKDLKDAGFSAAQLKAAGFKASELKDAGFSAADLKAAGFSARDLKDAGFSAADLKSAGFTPNALKDAGFASAEAPAPATSQVAALGNPASIQPGAFNVGGVPNVNAQVSASNQQLQEILTRQNQQMAEQRYQQKIQQKSNDMLAAANLMLTEWKGVATQTYTAGNAEDKGQGGNAAGVGGSANGNNPQGGVAGAAQSDQPAIIKTGDILFAVMDTAVNSDEPGPILATIVSGKLKGTKLIGSFNLPANSRQMIITFNTMSVPGASRTTSIAAYAIDPNTARTALSSKTNNHYLLRYGSLFASSFLEGFGNAFQSANTTVTIGGTGGGNNVTVSNGVGRSTLENAVIGLATVGKTWGQQAQQLFNRPTTVEVYSGTALGILFTQDVKTI